MKIVRSSWFPPKGYAAIMLVRWLIVRKGGAITSRLINHEETHQKQQLEMLVVFFFLWYGLEFVFRLFQYWNWSKAYRNVSFEREAYANQDNISYLPSRKRFAWFHYLKVNNYEN